MLKLNIRSFDESLIFVRHIFTLKDSWTLKFSEKIKICEKTSQLIQKMED